MKPGRSVSYIAGALILGYGLFAGARFAEDDQQASPAWLKWVSYALLIPAVYCWCKYS